MSASGKRTRVLCASCNKKCTGNVLRVQDKYFHIQCFHCAACSTSLAQGGFFMRDGKYYCSMDYQKMFGTKCASCGQFVEGEVVSALGNTYHQKCFICARCRKQFPPGDKVTFTGREVICTRCLSAPRTGLSAPASSLGNKVPSSPSKSSLNDFSNSKDQPTSSSVQKSQESLYRRTQQTRSSRSINRQDTANRCPECGEDILDGEALVALDRQWHVWCFKCTECRQVLDGEYMGKDGLPYCEKDYQKSFGVKCIHCTRYITGKVLQAGENNHFHPTCARCTKCGDPFGDGEEMFMQGGAIWHPRCGPGPGGNKKQYKVPATPSTDHDMNIIDSQYYMNPTSRYSSLSSFRSRSVSPSFSRSSYRSQSQFGRSRSPYYEKDPMNTDLNRVYTYSYLAAIPAHGYMKRQVDPRPAKSPQFFRPEGDHYSRRSRLSSVSPSRNRGMQVLVDHLRSSSPTRAKSPSMNNEEALEMAHYPDARKPEDKEVPRIERDDFPAPPFPFTDPERRRRWSESSKENDGEEENVNGKTMEGDHLKKEEEELSKISTGIGKVFLKELKEREKLRAWKLAHMDPRNSSRIASAKKEIPLRLRYDNPVNASPSRDMDRSKPWEEDPESFEISSQFRSSGGRSSTVPPSHMSSHRSFLKSYPKSPSSHVNGNRSTSALSKTQSIDFASNRSDISTAQSEMQMDQMAHYPINHSASHNFARGESPMCEIPVYGPGGSRYRGPSYAAHFRRSMPNVNLHQHTNEPAKMIPYHLLMTSNYRLPPNVDRCHLERHLSNDEFMAIFNCSRMDFYRLPEWKRNSLKKRAKLF